MGVSRTKVCVHFNNQYIWYKYVPAEFLPWLRAAGGSGSLRNLSPSRISPPFTGQVLSASLNAEEENQSLVVGCPVRFKAMWNFLAVQSAARASDPACSPLNLVADHSLGS